MGARSKRKSRPVAARPSFFKPPRPDATLDEIADAITDAICGAFNELRAKEGLPPIPGSKPLERK
jgi:hypothetical protein